MLIPSNFLNYPSTYALAAALYLDAYTNADGTTIYLPKRSYADVRDPKRLHHFTQWTRHTHTLYRAVPPQIEVTQFVVLDDGWTERTFELVADYFPVARDAAMRVMLYMWYNILFWSSYKHGSGFVTTHDRTAEQCGCTVEFANKVVLTMLDAELIHRKWIGNGLGHFGTCYMAGRQSNVDRLLELAENPI